MKLRRADLEPLACWFATDRVSHRTDITEFKRRARLRQAQWREAHGLPIGSHSRGDRTYSNGSKIDAPKRQLPVAADQFGRGSAPRCP
jgi:hypothetical protein